MFTKPLCSKCSENGKCCCQDKSQQDVNTCGMDEVIEHNRQINTSGQNYDNPNYVDFMTGY